MIRFGYALESFDSIGRWRTKYPKPEEENAAPCIDPSGELPSGEAYSDFASFKKTLLATRREVFIRNLIEQLLTYSTGRRMDLLDQQEIDEIFAQVEANQYGLRTMLTEVLTSSIFRSP